MSQVGKPQQIEIRFEEEKLNRLETRLHDAWLPDSPIVPDGDHHDWEYGTKLSKLKQVISSWKDGNPNGSDGKPVGPAIGVKKWWRGVEERLNRYPHFKVDIEGVSVHYQFAKSSKPDAIPLIFSHGWPGSFFEADLILQPLTEPTNGEQAFDVIVPSLVGYGLSSAPPRAGWELSDTARLFNTLMTSVLGYQSYVAQGGDWGYFVTRFLANYPECKAYHTNFAPPNPPIYARPIMTLETRYQYKGALAGRIMPYLFDEFETRGVVRGMEYLQEGSGYFSIQSTKPASLGYGFHDSPIAILSWLIEKFELWSDPTCPAFCSDPSKVEASSGINDENILINATIYYLSGSAHTSLLPYKENVKTIPKLATDKKLTNPAKHKPYGHSAFPYELAAGPKAWLPRLNVNLKFYNRHSYGGHFAALDNPQGLIQDLQEFFSANYVP